MNISNLTLTIYLYKLDKIAAFEMYMSMPYGVPDHIELTLSTANYGHLYRAFHNSLTLYISQ